ncbi:MAG: amidohydrolase [Anaerolineales bacterium]
MHILHNAQIYTLDPDRPTASALAIDHGRILAAGSDDQILAEFEDRGDVENVEGRTIIPGLTDAHIHLQKYAFNLQKVDCETTSLAECLRRVSEQHTPPGGWILGHGWNQNEWADCDGGVDGFPSAATLDEIAPDHPVYLTAKSLHAGWANTAALRQAGVTAQSADPDDGQIQHDARGEPTGILLEGAMRLVSSVIPKPANEQVAEAIREAQKTLWAMGITGLHDFDRRRCFFALQTLHGRGELGIRVVKSIPLADLPHAIEVGLRNKFGDDFLRIGPVKAFADGALGPHTAAMFQPYEDEPDNRGMLLLDAKGILEHGRAAVENGLGMAIHAIGDRANHEVIEAYAGLRAFEAEHGLPHPRHRIEHVQILQPEDIPRLAQLNVIASMQPTHAVSDMYTADRHWGKRAANAYAWRSLLEFGTRVAFGSDAPVESPNPFWGIHAAVTRRRADGSPGPNGWRSGQRLTRLEAIQGYTTGAVHAARLEDRLGKLSPGFLADLLVLDTDPFTCPPEAIREIRPAATMIGGVIRSGIFQK